MTRARHCGLILMWAATVPGWAHVRTSPEGFHINLPVPFNRLRDVMREVCSDGVVHGTFQYEHETVITGASTASESDAFPAWSGQGEVCYKVREHAVAPANFVATNDVGAVVVRYLVQPVSARETHISIDALFVEDGRKRRHLSRGTVETSEFREIAAELKAISDAERAQTEAAQAREEQQRKAEQAAGAKEQQQALAAETARLKAAEAAITDLEARLESLRRRSSARTKASGAVLQSAPSARANTVKLLSGGQVVKVLLRTRYWDRLRCPDGAEGWVYHLLLEPPPLPAVPPAQSYDANSLPEVRARRETLERDARQLADELRAWQPEPSAPLTFGAVTQPGSLVRLRPQSSSAVLFRAQLHDEFEVLEDRAAWIQVRAANGPSGWMRRGDLDLSAGMVVDHGAEPQISREELEEFSGEWRELRGKQAVFLWVRDADDKWSAAKRLFANQYLALTHAPRSGQPVPAGVVLVFNAKDPAVAAAGITQIRSWVEGEISEAAFIKRCSLDPESAFHP